VQSPGPVTLTVKVGLNATWHDVDTTMTTAAGGWTDISNRVLSFTMDRGRQDRTAAFEPGHISLILDGSDRMLDPLYGSSYVWNGAGYQQGGPLAPITVDATYQGSTYRVFSGFLSGELWRNRRTVGSMIEVDVSAVDRMGLFAQLDLPGSPFEAAVRLMAPDWWIRGIGGDLIAGNGSPLIDSSANGYYSVMTSPYGGQVITQRASMVAGDSDGAMSMTSTVQVTTGASGAVAATASLTAFCMWQGNPYGADQNILLQQDGSIVRWKVVCQTGTGTITVAIYNSAGTATTFFNAPPNPSSGGRWDDGQPHSVIFQFIGGSSALIAVDGQTASPTTGTPPATTAGSFIFGTSGQAASYDEVTFWRRVLSAQERAVLVGSANGSAYGYGLDSISDRIARWWQLAGVPADTSEAFYAHKIPSGTDTLLPMFMVPSNLADAYRRVAGSFGGVAFGTRDGRVRVRTLTTLTSGSFASDYATPTARISDAVSTTGTPPVVRRAPIQWSGVRAERIIDVSTANWNGLTFSTRNTSSVSRFGAREHRWDCDANSALTAMDIAGREIQRYQFPQIEMDPVQLDPTVDAAATLFLLYGCELEKAVTVVDTPMVGPVTSKLMNIQGEHWRWADGTNWTVMLDLAPS
jgi:hypothetical protein